MALEKPPGPPPSPRAVLADFGPAYAVNGVVAFIFAVTGPVAIILAVGARGGLTEADLASWIFGAFFVNSLISIVCCWLYRQPLVYFWTIPGAVLIGPALTHLTFPEVVGAYLVCGALMLALALLGWVRRWMDAIPMPIVMGMVAGVFLRFVLDLVYAIRDDFWIAAPMTVAFLALSAVPRVARFVPPLVVALVAGGIMIAVLGRFHPGDTVALGIARPGFYAPVFSWPALLELVVPLAITVLAVQNGQGTAILRARGHEPPVNSIAAACGAGALVIGCVGSVPTCLTGPVTALVSASGEKHRQYTAGMLVGALALVFGLFAPVVTHLLLATPPAFIAALGGLAMLSVLQTAFTVSFQGRYALGALVTFVVTVADVAIFNVGAAFWGLVFGFAVSWLLEREARRGESKDEG
jgi:benzoate membrane transport protein